MKIDQAMLERIRARLVASQRFVGRIQQVLVHVSRGERQTAGEEGRQVALRLLPTTHRGIFDPMSALADLIILLGLRAPLIWLALTFVRQQRSFTHILEFLVLAYCVVLLLMAGTGLAFDHALTAGLLFELIGIPVVAGGLLVLFFWLFALELRRGLPALVLALSLNLVAEHLLLVTHLL